MRDRIASGLMLLAVLGCLWLAHGLRPSLAAASVPLAFGIVYGSVAVGISRARPWARWLGMGLAISGAGSFWLVIPTIGFQLDPAVTWSGILAHVAVFCLLARADETPWQTRASLMLAGIPLLPLVFTWIDACVVVGLDGNAPRLALVAIPLALVGTVAVARSLTWGLFAVSAAGALLFFARPTMPHDGQFVMLMTTDMIQLTAIALVAVILPFAIPISRFLRHDRPV